MFQFDNKIPLLDKDYNSLSLQDKNSYLLEILSGLVGCSALEDEANDAREVFEEYDWVAKSGADEELFNNLLTIGKSHDMSVCDIDDFMELVSESGQYHLYYLVRKARDVVSYKSPCNSKHDLELTSSIIADFEIQDWKIKEGVDLPAEHKEVYRCVIEQSVSTSQVYFRLYPKVLDVCSDDLALNGFSGVLEVRNGKPAMSIGVNEDNICVHIESDAHSGVYVHTDQDVPPQPLSWHSASHDINFPALYYRCDQGAWLMEARSEIANKVFEGYQFQHDLLVSDTGGWSIEDGYWKQVCYFDNPTGGDTIKGYVELNFAKDSTMVLSMSDG
jgi:hypothetical protein